MVTTTGHNEDYHYCHMNLKITWTTDVSFAGTSYTLTGGIPLYQLIKLTE